MFERDVNGGINKNFKVNQFYWGLSCNVKYCSHNKRFKQIQPNCPKN